jgi:hypothetical protein
MGNKLSKAQKETLAMLESAAEILAISDFDNHRANWEFNNGYYSGMKRACIIMGIPQDAIDKATVSLSCPA